MGIYACDKRFRPISRRRDLLQVIGQIACDCSLIPGRGGAGNVTVGSYQPQSVFAEGRTKLGIEHSRKTFGQSGRRRCRLCKKGEAG